MYRYIPYSIDAIYTNSIYGIFLISKRTQKVNYFTMESTIDNWLVVSFFFIFHHILGIITQLTFIFFNMVETTNQYQLVIFHSYLSLPEGCLKLSEHLALSSWWCLLFQWDNQFPICVLLYTPDDLFHHLTVSACCGMMVEEIGATIPK